MIKVMFWDKTVIYVGDEAEKPLETIMGTQRKLRVKHLGNLNGDVFMGTAIYRITKATYNEYGHMLPRTDAKQLTAPQKPELTEEQLAERRAKIQKMKQDFFNRKEARKGGEQNGTETTSKSTT